MNIEKLFDTVKKDNTEIFAEPASWSSETSYYIQRFKKQVEHKGLKLSWNWPAALFGTTWLFYRKMFLYGFLYSILTVLMGYVFLQGLILTCDLSDLQYSAVKLAYLLFSAAALGFLGNTLYFYRIKTEKARKGTLNAFLAILLSILTSIITFAIFAILISLLGALVKF